MDRNALPELIAAPRLHLRPWRFRDVDDVLAYAQDPEWSRYLWSPHLHGLTEPYGRQDAEQFIARQLLLDRVTHPSWAVELQEGEIGGINLRFNFENSLCEIGYSIARTHWNRGYCTEGVRVVIDAAFSLHPDLNRIQAKADHRNTASQRVMEKAGMKREGVLRKSRVERGEAIDVAWFAILRSEWKS